MQHAFTISSLDRDTHARCGTLTLPHGPVDTPVFMPVGTAGTVKAIDHDTLHEIGFRLILANTYHLYLRPGEEVLRSFGGLHNFTTWNHNFLTDSGGYQVFSLAAIRTISEEGVTFQSHIDGSRHTLTPERVVDLQVTFNSDIQMALDVCTGANTSYEVAEEAMERTLRWGKRAVDRRNMYADYRGQLFPIIQGNFYCDLRRNSALRTVEQLTTTGIAIGGLSVGESFSQFEDTLAYTCEFIPKELPRYVMGIGTPEYILTAIEHGVDMFDCVFPTRAGRNATIFTRGGRLNMRNAKWAHDDDPIDPGFDSFGGRSYSKGYIRHLFKSNEILASILATEHNLRFMSWLIHEARVAVQASRFSAFKNEILDVYA